jgi:mannose-6-phosphate isomerase-like protein (cupin superfamily)
MTALVSYKGVSVEQSKSVVLMGDRYKVILDKDDTNGALGLIECDIRPQGGPPPHLNQREDLIWYVVENHLTFQLGERSQRVAAGECLFISKETEEYHTFHNDGEQPAKALLLVSPGGFEGFLRDAGVPEGTPEPAPSPEAVVQMVELGRKYGMDMKIE